MINGIVLASGRYSSLIAQSFSDSFICGVNFLLNLHLAYGVLAFVTF